MTKQEKPWVTRMKQNYGEDYFKKIGSKGGKNGHTGGFYANRELASSAGKIGGKLSKRGPGKKKREQDAKEEE